nr:hypothetical protein [Tanacetum cinerariifolium]
MSLIPPMTSPIINLTSRLESPKVHQQLKATTTETTTTTTKTTTSLPPPYQQQQSTADAMMTKHIGDLEHIMANLIQKNKMLKQRLDSHGEHLYTLEQLYIPHQVSKAVNEVVTDAVDWAMQAPLRNRFNLNSLQLHARRRKRVASKKTPPRSPPHQPPPPLPVAGPSGASGSPGAFGSSQVPPLPPPPPSTNPDSQSKGSAAPSSSKTASLAEYQAWMMTDIRLKPSISLTPTGDIAMFMDWFCKRRGITELKPLEVFYSLLDDQMSGPLVDGSSKNLFVFGWEVVQVTLKNQSINMAISPVYASSQSSRGGQHQDRRPPSSSR